MHYITIHYGLWYVLRGGLVHVLSLMVTSFVVQDIFLLWNVQFCRAKTFLLWKLFYVLECFLVLFIVPINHSLIFISLFNLFFLFASRSVVA